MLGSNVLDVVIGLVFVYLLLSLICSALREGIETRLKSRALHLHRGISEMLDVDSKSDLVRKLYDHPQIFPLFKGKYQAPLGRQDYGGLSWLPATIESWLRKTRRLCRPTSRHVTSLSLSSTLQREARIRRQALGPTLSRGDSSRRVETESPSRGASRLDRTRYGTRRSRGDNPRNSAMV